MGIAADKEVTYLPFLGLTDERIFYRFTVCGNGTQAGHMPKSRSGFLPFKDNLRDTTFGARIPKVLRNPGLHIEEVQDLEEELVELLGL